MSAAITSVIRDLLVMRLRLSAKQHRMLAAADPASGQLGQHFIDTAELMRDAADALAAACLRAMAMEADNA